MKDRIKKVFRNRQNIRPIIAFSIILLCICISFAIWICTYFDDQEYLLSQKDYIASDFSNVHLLDDYTIYDYQNDSIAVFLKHEGYALTCYFDKNFTLNEYNFNIAFPICQALVILAVSFFIGLFFSIIVLTILEKGNIIDPA